MCTEAMRDKKTATYIMRRKKEVPKAHCIDLKFRTDSSNAIALP